VERLEGLIAEACRVDRRMPAVRASGLRMWWPPMFHEEGDWGFYCVGEGEVMVDRSGRIEVYDWVMFDLLRGLSKERAWLLWARAGLGMSWRKIAKALHCSHEKVRQDYREVLKRLMTEKRELTVRQFLR